MNKHIPMNNKYTKEILEPIVLSSSSWAEVCRKLNVKPMTGAQTHISKKAKEYGIKYDHFLGQAWNKGKTYDKRNAIEYCYSGSSVTSYRLKEKLIRDGYKLKSCEICGLIEWENEEIPLELHHVDGDHFNNELINLQVICPNCHAIITKHNQQNKKQAKQKTINFTKNQLKEKFTNSIKNKSKRIKDNSDNINNCICGAVIKNNSKLCVKCYNEKQRTIIRPPHEQLLNEINELGYSATGRKYNVSDNAIRKWIKAYNMGK